MKKVNISAILLLSFFLLLCMLLLSCVSYYTQKSLRKNPLHKDNISVGTPSPIDGVWSDGYRMQRIDRGRMYYSIENKGKHKAFGYDTYWPMATMRDIVRVGPGRYRAMCFNTKVPQLTKNSLSRPCTLTVISDTKIAEKSGGKITQFYTRMKLDNEKWFFSDLALARQISSPKNERPMSLPVFKKSPPSGYATLPSIRIHRVSTEPDRVPQGRPFDIHVTYTAHDPRTSKGALPVIFAYQVREGNRTLFKSRPQIANSPNGHPTERIVHIKGAIEKGIYVIEVSLVYGVLHENEAVKLYVSE